MRCFLHDKDGLKPWKLDWWHSGDGGWGERWCLALIVFIIEELHFNIQAKNYKGIDDCYVEEETSASDKEGSSNDTD